MLESLPRKQVRGKWTYEKCVLAVVEYVTQLGAGEAPSRNGYRKGYTANGWPALNSVESHAHWSTMLDAAREALRTGELLSLEEAKRRWPSKIAQINEARPAAA